MFPSDSLPDMLLEAMLLYEFYTQFNSIAPTLNRLIPELSDVNFCRGLFKKDQELLKLLRDILEHRDRLFELIEYSELKCLPCLVPCLIFKQSQSGFLEVLRKHHQILVLWETKV